jgi:hypothetical protein
MQLVITFDGGGVRTLHLTPSVPVTLGRRPENSVQLDDALVSRRHARITLDADGLRVEDLGSRNGTRVNGAPIQIAVLHPGDRVVIGRTRIEVVVEATAGGDPRVVAGAGSGPRMEVIGGPRAGRSHRLDSPYVAFGELGSELAVVTAEGGGHAVRGLDGLGARLALNGVPLDEVARPLADGDRLQVGELELIYRGG